MNKLKQVGLWSAFALLIVWALGTFFSFATIAALLAAALIMPVTKWQELLQKYIKGKLKVIVAVVLSILALITFPSGEIDNDMSLPTQSSSTVTTAETSDSFATETTEASSVTTTAASTEATSDATPTPTTQPTEAPTTEPTTAPTSAPATAPTTSTAASVEPTEAPTTVSVHVHNFTSATCTEPRSCSCGATDGSANGHSWKEATCTEPKVCTVCNVTDGYALGHNYADGVCSICGGSDPNFAPNSPTSSSNSGIAGDPDGDDTNGQVVYRTPNGKRYHIDPDCGGENSYQITLGEALSAGLTPCNTCTK